MDDKTAKAIHDWIKASRKEFSGDRSEWARSFKRALDGFDVVIKLAAAGDLDAISRVGQ